jgi:hypothetical protein
MSDSFAADQTGGGRENRIGYQELWLQSFKDFPPRQKPGGFNLERVMEAVSKPVQN